MLEGGKVNTTSNASIYIYESPDGGKTIYRRDFLNYDEREIVVKDE
jgi:hypothetical protein